MRLIAYRVSTCTPPITLRVEFGPPVDALPIFPDSGALTSSCADGASWSEALPFPLFGGVACGEVAIAGCEKPGMSSSLRSSSSSARQVSHKQPANSAIAKVPACMN